MGTLQTQDGSEVRVGMGKSYPWDIHVHVFINLKQYQGVQRGNSGNKEKKIKISQSNRGTTLADRVAVLILYVICRIVN